MVDTRPAFRSYSWVLGTTTFRVATLNEGIEQQLLSLRELAETMSAQDIPWQWKANKKLQTELYNLFQRRRGRKASAKLPDKDARQLTSILVTLGLANNERTLTPAGSGLVQYAESGDFNRNNIFSIPADSHLYLRQLLKASLKVNDKFVRPYLVLAHMLNTFDYVTYEEFETLIPLVVDRESLELITNKLQEFRSGKSTVDDIIFQTVMRMDNYKAAQKLWMSSTVDADLFEAVGMNRKSRTYDRAYLPIYNQLKLIFLDGQQAAKDVHELYLHFETIPSKVASFWRKLVFKPTTIHTVSRHGASTFAEAHPFKLVNDETEFKKLFFKYFHLHKIRANLKEYFDQNRRYFKLTDTVIFQDQRVYFDTIPKEYFGLVGDLLLDEMFVENRRLQEDLPIANFSPILHIHQEKLLEALSTSHGVELKSLSDAFDLVEANRYRRLHELLDRTLHRGALVTLLDHINERNDRQIAEMVTENATPSTIFEYILALVWYELSGRSGNILSYMKLSLEADLLPRSHARGGTADIIYEYDASDVYPRHDLLIEATLADSSNVRRMEMEPVPRHLGEHIFKSGNSNDYCVFVAPEIDVNVASDFRFRKQSGYWDKAGNESVSLKIIPLDIGQVKELLINKVSYSDLYVHLEAAYQSTVVQPKAWRNELEELLQEAYLTAKKRSEEPGAAERTLTDEHLRNPNGSGHNRAGHEGARHHDR